MADTLVLIIDNYDSFVYNLVNVLAELGARSIVVRNDEISVRGVERIDPDRIIISPGPGSPLKPRDVGVSIEIVRRLGWRIPILGVCLGHQVVGVAFGARIRRAKRIMHGKTDTVRHNGGKLYRGVPSEFTAMRYHSLVIDDVPSVLKVEARSVVDNEIMGVRHVEHPIHGVQFHPESIGTPYGPQILKNFLDDPW
ncbi:glutamine amidotransferase of anthranilate synthase [Pyrolobus fumarii 1A]|uniref:anthranilate synthase n=1 Tax=Pyrolobus fumarii (strain DSM 11204 / 1A) TaxID=694429 RepID=G0EF06_PYRF1|nr:aminodeoxychorismate/anthranilate synthase component II [Pyrolobus fumarii]AEM38903.1 glutamine amidotransferase of anthranilate synthase [Pyrolobus fumarii 1A]